MKPIHQSGDCLPVILLALGVLAFIISIIYIVGKEANRRQENRSS
jgi:hypothetical protein